MQKSSLYIDNGNVGVSGKKVLVVDDNINNLNILERQLKQWNVIPVLASSGKEALDKLSEDCDLIIADLHMPEMDGIQLAQRIRLRNSSVPVILMSPINNEQSRSNIDLFSAILNKPVRQNILRDHIYMQLKSQQASVLPVSNKVLSAQFAAKYPLDILITEDNPVNQKLAERVLTKMGYQPDKALNGLEALELLKRKSYDVIFMDVQMPEMDGMECTQRVRKQEIRQPVIIAMTANAMQGDREKCIQAGMDDYISKPIRLEDLVAILEKWATRHNGATIRKLNSR
jgi:CheY-like chemotaxis protein